MAEHITPGQRARILTAIQNEGMSLSDAARTFLVSESDIWTWITKDSSKDYRVLLEVERLKQENKELKKVIRELVRRKGPAGDCEVLR